MDGDDRLQPAFFVGDEMHVLMGVEIGWPQGVVDMSWAPFQDQQ